MRIHLYAGLAIAGLLSSGAVLATEPEAPEAADSITVEDALAEPADPDDALDIRADDDPNDVGQEALDPELGELDSAAGSTTPEGENP